MAEFIVWIIHFTLFGGAVIFITYWIRLLQNKEELHRKELIDFFDIIKKEAQKLFPRSHVPVGYITFLLGIILAWLLVFLGGLFSPAMGSLPDYASSELTNYFFQSILFPGVLHFIWPLFKENVALSGTSPNAFLKRFTESDVPFFFGLCVSLGSLNLTLWGIYHDMSFLYCAFNAVFCFIYAGIRFPSSNESLSESAEHDPLDQDDDLYSVPEFDPDESPDMMDDFR